MSTTPTVTPVEVSLGPTDTLATVTERVAEAKSARPELTEAAIVVSGGRGVASAENFAVIEGLAALKRPCKVVIYLDSQYVRQGITEWIHGWKAKGWRTSTKQPVKNAELWQRLDKLVHESGHQIEWRWVKGHSGDPGNERADMLANKGVLRAQGRL